MKVALFMTGKITGLIILVTGLSVNTIANESMSTHNHASMKHDEHTAHKTMMKQKSYSVTNEHYAIPNIELIDASGANVQLNSLLNGQQPVALNFIFTTCNTICPVMTATFSHMKHQLGKAASDIRLVSITIDPEYDRPAVLKKYSEQFSTGPNWDFLTGEGRDITEVIHSFKAHFGSKMNHRPLTLLKSPDKNSWIRIDGLASGKDLAQIITKRLLN